MFVESDAEAVRAIERNLDKLGLTGARVVRLDAVTGWRRKRGRAESTISCSRTPRTP